MSIVAPKIPANVFNDVFEVLKAHPWMNDHADALTALWNICDTVEERSLVKTLVMDFFLLDSRRELEALNALAQQVQEWGLLPTNTWVVAAANGSEIDGSHAAMQKLKNKINPIASWHSRFLSNIPAASGAAKNGDVVVILDDFIGTGEKMIKKSDWLIRLAAEKGVHSLKLYFLSIAGMKSGLESIRKNAGYQVFSYYAFDKAISDKYEPEKVNYLIGLMQGIESRLALKYKNKARSDYSMGYKASEALYCAENDNCPNNVFPVFWWGKLSSGEEFQTIFSRAG